MLINFAKHAWRAAVTDDFDVFVAVDAARTFYDLNWLAEV